MKSFLLLPNGTPNLKWGSIPSGVHFEGALPFGYKLAVAPSKNCVIVDIDKKGDKNGFNHIPVNILNELTYSYHYNTKSGGMHIFLYYNGNQILKNTSTKYGIDLRIGAKDENCGGYVRYSPKEQGDDIRNHMHEIMQTSLELNIWLEKLFS